MTALDLFRLRYDVVHGPLVDELFQGLTDAQLREQPHGLNSVVWLVWHATRVQDATIRRLVVDRSQVLDEGGWNARMGLDRRDVGPGMTAEDVAELSARIDIQPLRAYHAAVAAATMEVAATLAPPRWEEIVPPERVRSVVADEAILLPAGRWVGEFWAGGRPRAWFLLQTGLLHPYGHWFDAMATRGRVSP